MTEHAPHTIRGAYVLVGSGVSLTRWPLMRDHEVGPDRWTVWPVRTSSDPAAVAGRARAGEHAGCQVFSGRA